MKFLTFSQRGQLRIAFSLRSSRRLYRGHSFVFTLHVASLGGRRGQSES